MGPKAGARDQTRRETETKREHKAKSNRRNGEFGERRVVPGRFSGPRRGDVIVYHRPNLQSLHPLPHDRESGLGAISREWRDAIVAHGARGRADDGDRVERCIRFEHICSVLGVFAGGACVPRSFFFLSETFGVGARDLSLLWPRERGAKEEHATDVFFSPFSLQVMYDATGVRLHAGRQAEVLNQLIVELPRDHPLTDSRPLRDSLGHTPVQVAVGALLGMVVGYAHFNIWLISQGVDL